MIAYCQITQQGTWWTSDNWPGAAGTTGGGTGGRDLDNSEYEVNDDEECCLTATRADISITSLTPYLFTLSNVIVFVKYFLKPKYDNLLLLCSVRITFYTTLCRGIFWHKMFMNFRASNRNVYVNYETNG